MIYLLYDFNQIIHASIDKWDKKLDELSCMELNFVHVESNLEKFQRESSVCIAIG